MYFTGDTDYHSILGYIAEHRPDVMVTVINGGFRNLGPREAADLTVMIDPRVVIPCHYDLFADNSVDPRLFRTNLRIAGLADRYRPLTHGEPYEYPEGPGTGAA